MKLEMTNAIQTILLGLVLTGLAPAGCDRQRPEPQPQAAATRPGGVWWRQDTVATWTNFGYPPQEKWLEFIKQIGTTACDRGLSSVHAEGPGVRASIADYHHKRGLRLTSFFTIHNWRPDEQYMEELIARMRRDLDDGCDGIHLDMLFSVANQKQNVDESDAGIRAVAKMRDAVHSHLHKPRAMFAGNAWQLDGKFGVQVAQLCDVAWVETWGHDDLDLVRVARVARSLDDGAKPTWYHWQPDDNEQARVEKLVNLPRALYASCMMEGAVFLCNYQYPVRITHKDRKGRNTEDWKMIPINPGWRESVVRYARFALAHADMLRNARPAAPVIVAFRPWRVWQANKIMRDLLRAGVIFNVHVSGRWPFKQVRAKDLAGYKAVISLDPAWVKSATNAPVYTSARALLAAAGPEVRDFCRVDGNAKVLARVLTRDGKMFIHLKQYGYTDKADDVPALGPLTLRLHSERSIRKVTCFSPDTTGSTSLEFSQQASQAKITVPTLRFYTLVVVDLEH